MSEVVIECHKVSKTFTDSGGSVQVLQQLDFALQAGEQVAIVGTSGSGKSTLLHLLAGLEQPSSGAIKVMGNSWEGLNTAEMSRLRQQHIGMVFQFHHLLPEFSALENVAMPLLLGKASCREIQKRAERILTAVNLEQRFHHRVAQLSGGERQRVAIARALVTQPVCVLADEPTGNLDQNTAVQVRALIRQLSKEFNTSFVIVTHDLVWARQMDRTLWLSQGRLQEEIAA